MTLARLAFATGLIFAALAVPAPAQEMKSENVEVLGKFPEDAGATGARWGFACALPVRRGV